MKEKKETRGRKKRTKTFKPVDSTASKVINIAEISKILTNSSGTIRNNRTIAEFWHQDFVELYMYVENWLQKAQEKKKQNESTFKHENKIS